MITITVNGNPQNTATPVSLAKLMILNKITQPEMVSIQLNGEFVSSEEYETIELKDGDEIDFLYFMGGGAVQNSKHKTQN